MNVWFNRLVDVTGVVKDQIMLKEALSKLTRDAGFDYYAYLNVRPIGTFAISNYPEEWQRFYLDRRYERIDPIIAQARERMRTFTWSSEKDRRAMSKAARRFYMQAAQFGILSGVTMPILTPFGHISVLTIASRRGSLPPIGEIDAIVAANAVALLHARVEQMEVVPTAQSDVHLTPRQALLLKWAAEGKTMQAIAKIENMSYHNVNFHLNNARKALEAGTLTQATALATKLGLI